MPEVAVKIITHTSGKKIPIAEATPTQIVQEIKAGGCDMLAGKIDGTESKKELVEYLKLCRCPVLKKKFSGIE